MSQISETFDPRAAPQGDPAFFHLRLVGKVALTVSGVTGLILLGVVIGAAEGGGSSYGQIIETFSATRHNLGLALTLSGLAIVAVAGLLAWLIAVYGSFRIAGPLYRFTRNLELLAAAGPGSVQGIRKGDCLQDEARRLADSVAALRDHYDAIRTLVERIEEQLESPPSNGREALAATVLQLKKVDGQRRI